MSIDPTKFQVESHSAPIWEEEQSFQEMMADQLRHAPWLLLSIVIHAIVIGVLWALPSAARPAWRLTGKQARRGEARRRGHHGRSPACDAALNADGRA